MKTNFKSPSVGAMAPIWGIEKAKRVKAIFKMTRIELENTEAGNARVRECHNSPTTSDIRLHVLNKELETYGIESFPLRGGGYCDYLNTGDTYATTIVRFNGNYILSSWGDIAEKHAAE